MDVDRVQFELAVLNLAVNARDAMPEGGVLSIVTRRLGPGEVELSVTDTGQGMAEEVRARIFDPFFTTKPPGVGTGLGLTQVYGFAKHARGSIEARSRPGRGTTMTLRLPAAEPSAVQAASSPAPYRRRAASDRRSSSNAPRSRRSIDTNRSFGRAGAIATASIPSPCSIRSSSVR